jgi:hypothetical protein
MPDTINNETEQLLNDLFEAAREAGLQPSDPMTPLIGCLAQVIRFLDQRTAKSDRIAINASKRIVQTIGQSHQASEAEEKRILAALATAEADTVRRIATAIVKTADGAWTRRVEVFDRNSAMLAGFLLFAVAATSIACGSWWGRSSAEGAFRETEAGLREAFIDGPGSAYAWRELMQWNDLRGSLAACDAAPGRIHIQDGRRWCEVPLWIENPSNPRAPRP